MADSSSSSARARVLIIAVIIFAALGALIWFLSVRYRSQPVTPLALPTPGSTIESVATPTPLAVAPTPDTNAPQTSPTATPLASPSNSNSAGASPSQTPTPVNPTSSISGNDASRPLIPVAGVRPEELRDTFTDARSEGRVHDAIDIMAPRNTPVLAAVDGRIVKLFQSARGGITIYQLGTDERMVYYYAHLERYADGLQEGHVARRGETIAYVGDTGNAAPGNTHLHFQIYTITDPKHFWDGTNINPYPLLRGSKN